MLNKCFSLLGFNNVNWFLSNTSFTLFLNTSISVYGCILIIIMIVSLIKKQYVIFCIACIEFMFTMNFNDQI